MPVRDLLQGELKVVNIGLPAFKSGLERAGVPVVHVDWRPPLEVSEAARRVIVAGADRIAQANAQVMQTILRGRPHLVGLARAGEVIPGLQTDMILHAGPPIAWERICGPLRGAIIGGLIYEGRAATPQAAEQLAASGRITYEPCHQHSSVGPMAGVVTPRMPVFVIRNEEFGNHAYCTMNEGLGKVLRYGAYGQDVIARLKWMEEVLYPVLQRAVAETGPIDLKTIIAQALHMGDEVHNRNRAATSLLLRLLAPAIARTCSDGQAAARVLEFIHQNDHFFLNLSMPACKATLDAARDVATSSIVVAMTRNGTDFGIQLSGTGSEWFTGPAEVPDALFFPGFGRDDANPDIGDSAITETNGLGGFAIAAAPAIVQFVGGSAATATETTQQMYEITSAENDVYQVPYLDFRGTPTGIDVIKVVQKNVLPFIDTGVAHKEPGIGQVGAGILSAPAEPFRRALEGLAARLAQGPASSGQTEAAGEPKGP
jgi:hypothetical protein